MTSPRVELVYSGDCPNVGAARLQVLRAFGRVGKPPHWREWRTDDPSCPPSLRAHGSPTILVNGRDAAGASIADAACCRVYAQSDGRLAGVPAVEQIASALQALSGSHARWNSAALGGPALAVAFLPKLACPACWPAYAAAVSALGLTFLLEMRYLLPLTIAALALAVVALLWQAPARRGYGPAALALAAATLIVAGKFAIESAAMLYGGGAAFAGAFLWNAWPRRAVQGDCPSCDRPGASGSDTTSNGGPHESEAKG